MNRERYEELAQKRAVILEGGIAEIPVKTIVESKRARGFEIVEDWARSFPEAEPVIPRRKTMSAMAYDFTSLETVTLMPGEEYHFMTDIKAYMGDTECLIMNVRSSIGFKKKLMLVNTQGWIDSDFYSNPDNDGNIGICLKNIGKEPQIIEAGERIAQGAFFNFLSKDDDHLDEKEERKGGIGSTGTK